MLKAGGLPKFFLQATGADPSLVQENEHKQNTLKIDISHREKRLSKLQAEIEESKHRHNNNGESPKLKLNLENNQDHLSLNVAQVTAANNKEKTPTSGINRTNKKSSFYKPA